MSNLSAPCEFIWHDKNRLNRAAIVLQVQHGCGELALQALPLKKNNTPSILAANKPFLAMGIGFKRRVKNTTKIEPQSYRNLPQFAARLNTLNRNARLAHELPSETLMFTTCTSCKLLNPNFHKFCTIIIRFAAPKLPTMVCTHASRHAQKVAKNTSDLQYLPYTNARAQHAWNS